MVPAIYYAINWYGPIGAAFVWVLLNGIYMHSECRSLTAAY